MTRFKRFMVDFEDLPALEKSVDEQVRRLRCNAAALLRAAPRCRWRPRTGATAKQAP
jgi:hypothetical protein